MAWQPRVRVSICTFVLEKQVNLGFRMYLPRHIPYADRRVVGAGEDEVAYHHLLCQYLYFCTSKAIKTEYRLPPCIRWRRRGSISPAAYVIRQHTPAYASIRAVYRHAYAGVVAAVHHRMPPRILTRQRTSYVSIRQDTVDDRTVCPRGS